MEGVTVVRSADDHPRQVRGGTVGALLYFNGTTRRPARGPAAFRLPPSDFDVADTYSVAVVATDGAGHTSALVTITFTYND
jgi:hypothetical protein